MSLFKTRDIPLIKPDLRIKDIIRAARVLRSGQLVQGKEVRRLENTVSGYLNTGFCSAVSSGTASLHLALVALGVGPGDKVIVPAFSFVATANVVELTGAECVFVDIDPRYYNIDETRIEEAINEKTKAIMPVHEFGLCAGMDRIMDIALRHNVFVIEDAACALGAKFNGRYAGTFGHFGSFSLHPRKAITSGEGGLVLTGDSILDRKIKVLRNHGIDPDSSPLNMFEAGFNYRITEFQAAMLNSQLERLEDILKVKERLACIYLSEIRNSSVILPEVPLGSRHTWQTFHIRLECHEQREKLSSYLRTNGIMTNYGAQCIPSMTYYSGKYKIEAEKDYPGAFNAYRCGLAIPLYNTLSASQIKRISSLINKF